MKEGKEGEEGARSTWFLARRIYLAGLAATYAIAFGSLWVQVHGLFGERGIAPIARTVAELRAAGASFFDVPTILWWGASDRALDLVCGAGLVLAVLALVGLVPRIALALDWLLYLSLAAPGEPFLSFQWDVLLLEAGFLAIFLAPGGLRPFARRDLPPPSNAALGLVRWLLLRLMLLSSLVKLLSGDPSWRALEALDYHYWTQPLPHRGAVLADALPEWTRHVSVAAMFAIELGVPLLVFGARRMKQAAAAAVALLMALIAATGNYGFFNLLTLVLCAPLLDDRAWRALLRRSAAAPPRDSPPARVPSRAKKAAVAGGVVLVLVLTTASAALRLGVQLPRPIAWLHERAAPLESFNAYGLFSVMTKERPEIVIEGSRDGVEWRAYRLRYGPLELERAPVYAGLHMPRLDWQLWFAALDADRPWRARWYEDFLRRLLEGSPAVLALLREDPFDGVPPKYLRSTVWEYRFATADERERGLWWGRDRPRPYVPTVTLVDGELRAVSR